MEDVNVADLPTFADSVYKELMRGHEKRFEARIKNVNRASDELSTVASRLEVSIRNAWGSLDKTTSEQGLRLVQTIKELTHQISNQSIPSDYNGLESLHKTSVEASDKIIITIRKYVPKLYKAMKTEIASLNSSLTRLETTINEFGTSLDNSPGSEIESLRKDIHTLLHKEHTLKELVAENRQIRKTVASSVDEEKTLLHEQENLLSHDGFRQLLQLEDASRSKAEATEQFLQPLAKALKKYERIMSDNKSIDHVVLTRLVENPRAAVSETDFHTLLHIFNALNGALSRGELGIEERKRKRAEEVILSIKQGDLEQLRTEQVEIQNRIKKTNDQLQATGLLHTKEELTEAITRTQSKTAQLNMQLAENEKRIEAITGTISKEKLLIENEIARLSGKKVTIRTEPSIH